MAALGLVSKGGRAPPGGAVAAGRPLARSVVAVALAGLVEEAPRTLSGPAGWALSGPVLPLQRLLAEPWLFCQLLGPLHPPCLADLLQDGSLHRQGRGVVRCVPLQPGLWHLPAERRDRQQPAVLGPPPQPRGHRAHAPSAHPRPPCSPVVALLPPVPSKPVGRSPQPPHVHPAPNKICSLACS